MQFLWPDLLWLLLLVPLLVAAYVWALRRRKVAVRYASLLLVRDAVGPGQRLRRHVPPALFLLGLMAAIVAVARPTASVVLPSQVMTVALAMDVSLSMKASDVDPNRLSAAQTAAKAFVAELPRNVRVGIVSFAGTAAVVQTPTENRDDMITAIERFQLQRGTATGSGLMLALSLLFPDDGIDEDPAAFNTEFLRMLEGRGAPLDRDRRTDTAKRAEPKPVTPAAPGSYTSGAIILLSDGRRTTGPDPLAVAKMAADRGVRVYTVGFGTVEGANIEFDGFSVFVRLDEDTLKAIAKATAGEYFHAGTAADLRTVYENLSARLALESRETEIGALFSAAAALLMLVAAVLSVLWFHRGAGIGLRVAR